MSDIVFWGGGYDIHKIMLRMNMILKNWWVVRDTSVMPLPPPRMRPKIPPQDLLYVCTRRIL